MFAANCGGRIYWGAGQLELFYMKPLLECQLATAIEQKVTHHGASEVLEKFTGK